MYKKIIAAHEQGKSEFALMQMTCGNALLIDLVNELLK